MYAVGIDLGTTNSAVAIIKGRPSIIEDITGNKTLPSAVGWDPDLNDFVIGIDAKENGGLYQTVLSIKRLMGTDKRTLIGSREMLPEEISAEILKVLKKQVEERTGETVTDAIITVPAHFEMAAMQATKKAGELAGLKVQQLLAEPSAAVMAYGPKDDEKILVYDLGGGTFDVTIIDYFAGVLTTLAVFGDNCLGGDDFDLRLAKHLCGVIKAEHGIDIDLKTDKVAYLTLKRASEEAKIRLSRVGTAPIQIAKVTEVNGRPVGVDTAVKRGEFNRLTKDLVDRTLEEVQKALDYAKLSKSDIDTVLLVGGSTYIPLVQETLRDFFGKEPNKSVNPDLAVALGAAASLVQEPPTDRHVVTVGFIPEATPESVFELTGRTSPHSELRITGGCDPVIASADETGYYSAKIALRRGSNTLTVTATAPNGKKCTLETEPVVHDPEADEVEEPPQPPQPRLPWAVGISCSIPVGANRIIHDAASVILKPQTELPASFSADHFATAADNQEMLVGMVLVGELPLADLNMRLGEIRLLLPPNVPANERVVVHFSVDESYQLTADLEVPSVNKRTSVRITLDSSDEQMHIFTEMDKVLTDAGDRIRTEEKASLEQSRLTIEDLTRKYREQEKASNGDGLWATYNQLTGEADRLRTMLDSIRQKYR